MDGDSNQREAEARGRQRELIALARDEAARMRASNAVNTSFPKSESAENSLITGSSHQQLDSIAGYEIMEPIHRGGQGVVYKALQKSTRRHVAIKVMKEGPFATRAENARFDREVQALALLKHPNIIAIHDSGVSMGHYYFVMDYVPGLALDAYVRERCKDQSQILTLFAKTCEAVHAAHVRGIIHRDLKPGNISIDDQGEPHVLDFGLAKVSEFNEEASVVTITGQFVGSIPWASPEQAEGVPGKIDLRTDVYSLGVLLYQVLTGQFPYEVVGTMREVTDRIIYCEPTPPHTIAKHIDDELETVVLKALAKDPDRRYQTAGELALDIRRYLNGDAVAAKRDSLTYLIRKKFRRHRLLLTVTVSAIIVLGIISIVALKAQLASHQSLQIANERAWSNYLYQAQSKRQSGAAGRRFESLAAISAAATIRPSLELRNEAIASMTLVDVRRIEPSPVVTDARPATAPCMAPTLDLFAYADMAGNSRLRDAYSGRELMQIPNPGMSIGFQALSADSKFLFACYGDGDEYWRLWNLETRTTFLEGPHCNRGFAMSASGKLAVGRVDGDIDFYDFPAEGTVADEVLPPVEATWLAFDPAGNRLARNGENPRDVHIIDTTTGQILTTFTHAFPAIARSWSPNGKQLAVSCADNHIYLWDVVTGHRHAPMVGHTHRVSYLWFRADDLLVSNAWDGTSRFWDPITERQTLKFWGSIKQVGHRANLVGCERPIGDGRVRFEVWEVARGDVCRRFVAPNPTGHRMADGTFSPTGRIFVSFSDDGLRVWDVECITQVAYIPIAKTESLAFEPISASLITSGRDGLMKWRIDQCGNGLCMGPPTSLLPDLPARDLGMVQISKDGSTIAVQYKSSEVLMTPLGETEKRKFLAKHDPQLFLSLSPDNSLLATSAYRGVDAKVWNTATGALESQVAVPGESWVQFSPDGQTLIIQTDAMLQTWSLRTKELKTRMTAESEVEIGHAAYSPDGAVLAVITSRNRIKLLDASTFEELATLPMPEEATVGTIIFSPDGTKLAATTFWSHIW